VFDFYSLFSTAFASLPDGFEEQYASYSGVIASGSDQGSVASESGSESEDEVY